ncbi:MAG: PfkB family carbohydrate kinase [Faecousia sp.]
MMEKHVLILSDFVGYGNVAMATSRAVLTKLGHRVYCLPTALISNTWNFGACAQLSTTDYLRASLETWQKLGFRFDGVLIGYIADQAQAEWLGEQCAAWHRAGVRIFLDPIFADNGKLYRGMTEQRLDFLRGLLKQVDFVLPNVSEARFLSGEDDPLQALRGLLNLGAGCAAVTGVPREGENAVLLGDAERTEILSYTPIPGNFSGAGDAFTALFTGGILSGQSPHASARAAVESTKQWITKSLEENWQGMGLPVERYF